MQRETVDVSVIIPAFRAAQTITRTLMSVAHQTVRPREIVVVDDGSDDETVNVIEAARPNMMGISLVVIAQENGGAGSARNRAIAHARGKWLAFLDADDEWLPEKLAATFAAIAASGRDPVLVSHDVIVQDGESSTVFDCAAHDVGEADPFHAMYRRGYVSTSTALAKRDAVVRAGGFDISLANAQDFDLWLAMLSSANAQVLVFPGAHTRHHNQPDSIQTFTDRRLACGLKIARRYGRTLRMRKGSALLSIAFRGLAIHAEALATHLKCGRIGNMLKTLIFMPFRFAALLALGLSGTATRRLSFIPDSDIHGHPGQP